MIKQVVQTLDKCPGCGSELFFHDLVGFHPDDEARPGGFLWAYQEWTHTAYEVEYRCLCGMQNDRVMMFPDGRGDMWISPLQRGVRLRERRSRRDR